MPLPNSIKTLIQTNLDYSKRQLERANGEVDMKKKELERSSLDRDEIALYINEAEAFLTESESNA